VIVAKAKLITHFAKAVPTVSDSAREKNIRFQFIQPAQHSDKQAVTKD
jgi:hypothetical protein